MTSLEAFVDLSKYIKKLLSAKNTKLLKVTGKESIKILKRSVDNLLGTAILFVFSVVASTSY